VAFPAEHPVANRIHAPVETMKAAGVHSPGDCALVQAGNCKLSKRDHPMLSTRDPGDHPVGPGAFLSHIERKAPAAADSRPV
jgi:hypothetical protein